LVLNFAGFSTKIDRKIISAAIHANLSHKFAINSFAWCTMRPSAVTSFNPNSLAAAPYFLISASGKNILHFALNFRL
jgi:hypothetical protein